MLPNERGEAILDIKDVGILKPISIGFKYDDDIIVDYFKKQDNHLQSRHLNVR